MKKLILFSLLCLVLTFSACGNGNTSETQEVTEWKPSSVAETKEKSIGNVGVQEEQVKIEEKEETIQVEVVTQPLETEEPTEETEKPTETEKTTQVPTQGVANPNGHIPVTTAMGSFGKGDTDFVYKKSTLKLNDKIENIFKKIGEDNISQEISKNRMEYSYEDFTLYTRIDKNNNETLERILIKKKNIPTTKGVEIGDYASALVRIYGNPTKQESGIKYYEKDGKQLIFKYENNLITAIIYQYKG